jgi:predicted  nucleic acid-binding Zn-ribbon protein
MEFEEFYDKIMFSIEDHMYGRISLEKFRENMIQLQGEECAYEDEIRDLKADIDALNNEMDSMEIKLKDAEKEIDRLEKILFDHDIEYGE